MENYVWILNSHYVLSHYICFTLLNGILYSIGLCTLNAHEYERDFEHSYVGNVRVNMFTNGAITYR